MVIAPIPFSPPLKIVPRWLKQSRVPARETLDGNIVYHPRFAVLPKLDLFSGLTYFFGILRTIMQLTKNNKNCILHAHFAYPDGVGVALAARVLKIPYVITAHGSDINVYASRWFLRSQIRWALRGAAGVIAVSGALQTKVGALTNTDSKRLVHIPCSGYVPAMFSNRGHTNISEAFGLPPNARIIIFVGNLVPIKGPDILVDAWGLLTHGGGVGENDYLVFIGEGSERYKLEKMLKLTNSDANTRFAGSISQHEVSLWMSVATLLCVPSRNEGTPNVVVEAIASGLPVVATAVGGIPEVVTDLLNGRLVIPENPLQLSEALTMALHHHWDRDLICASVSHLTWTRLASRNLHFLTSTLDAQKNIS